MKKVYCKNCKYFAIMSIITSSIGRRGIDYYCDPNKTVKFGFWGAKEYNTKNMFLCSEVKPTGCKYYKKKWWKFWVKEMY